MIEDKAPRILLVTRNMPPLWGGMEQLNWHMADELAHKGDVRLIGPQGSSEKAPAGVDVSEVPLKPLSKFLLVALWRCVAIARLWRPDVILAGSGLTAPIAWLAARLCGARSAAYVHGLDVAVTHPLYRYFWIRALRRMDRVIANSHATALMAKRVGIDATRIGIVYPGVSMPESCVDAAAVESLRAEQNWNARPILLSVGRLTMRKGLREFVTEVLPKIAARHPDVLLLVVGDVPANSLHAQAQTPESIQAAAAAAGVANNVQFMGVITDRRRLAVIYQTSHVHVFPVRHIPGDPEGFGMVAVEAAAHGLPTVSYATGGIPDAVAEGVSGYLLQPGDTLNFAAAVLRLLEKPLSPNGARAFAETFSWRYFGVAIMQNLTLEKR